MARTATGLVSPSRSARAKHWGCTPSVWLLSRRDGHAYRRRDRPGAASSARRLRRHRGKGAHDPPDPRPKRPGAPTHPSRLARGRAGRRPLRGGLSAVLWAPSVRRGTSIVLDGSRTRVRARSRSRAPEHATGADLWLPRACADPRHARRASSAVPTSLNLDDAVDAAAAGHAVLADAAACTVWATGSTTRWPPRTTWPSSAHPGAVLDGQTPNLYAFTGRRTDVTDRAPHDPELRHQSRRTTRRGRGQPRRRRRLEDPAQHRPEERRRRGLPRRRQRRRRQLPAGQRPVRLQRLRAPDGVASDRRLDHNEIAGNNTDDWETARSTAAAAPAAASSGRPPDADVTDNWVHDNHSVGLWADTNNTRLPHLAATTSTATTPRASSTRPATTRRSRTTPSSRNGLVAGPEDARLPDPGALPLRVRQRPAGRRGVRHAFRIIGNRFMDNWAGVIAVGERRPLLRLTGEHQHGSDAPW